jgi:hypothetical protein
VIADRIILGGAWVSGGDARGAENFELLMKTFGG